MASKEISDEKEVENDVTLPQKKQTTSLFFPSYTKSYSQTSIEIIKFDYTWIIKNIEYFYDNVKILKSPSFPKSNQYMIRMELPLYFPENHDKGEVVKLYLLSAEPFNGTLTIHCEFKISYNLKNISINTYDLPPPTVSKDLKSLEDSTRNKIKNEEFITLILSNTKSYNISKQLLCNISNYFKDICITHEIEEKDLTKELNESDVLIFEKMLFIIIGTQTVESCDYYMVTKLLPIAARYDVQTVKLSCEYYLLSHINIDNALELMHLTILSYAKLLEMHLAIFIKFHMKEILNSEKLNENNITLNKVMKVLEKYNKLQKHETITHFNSLTVESLDDC